MTEDRVVSPREQIAAVAQAMLDGGVEPQDGCREICRLRHQLSEPETYDQDLLVFVGIDSELDDCPTGLARQYWAPSALAEKDQQRDEYLRRVKDALTKACRALAMWR
jgi:hypothetical protein